MHWVECRYCVVTIGVIAAVFTASLWHSLAAQSGSPRYRTLWETSRTATDEASSRNAGSGGHFTIESARDVERMPDKCTFLSLNYFGDDLTLPAGKTVSQVAIGCEDAKGAIKYVAGSPTFADLTYLRFDSKGSLAEYLPHIAKLKSLKELVVRVYSQEGVADLSPMAANERLEGIFVSWYSATDCTIVGFEKLPLLSWVRLISLGSCASQTLLAFSRCQTLKALDIGGVRLAGDAHAMVATLDSVEHLVLPGRSGHETRWGRELFGLVTLKSLSVPTGDFDLAVLNAYTELVELILGGVVLDTTPTADRKWLNTIEAVQLDHARLHPGILAALSGASRLRVLSLVKTSGYDASDLGASLARLSKLQHLWLNGSTVNLGAEVAKQLPAELITLCLDDCSLCDAAFVNGLTERCPLLQSLSLAYVNIPDIDALGTVGRLTSLVWLDLSGSSVINDALLETVFTRCTGVHEVRLNGCDQISDKGVLQALKASSVKRLAVSGCKNVSRGAKDQLVAAGIELER